VTSATSWPGRAWQLLRGTLRRFGDDDALRLSASLAFYSIFSLAPLLVIVVAIAGLVFGDEAVSGRLARQLEHVMGSQSAETVQSMVESARKPMDNVLAMVVGAATLLSGASGVFTQLRGALNRIWDVDGKPAHGWRSARNGSSAATGECAQFRRFRYRAMPPLGDGSSSAPLG